MSDFSAMKCIETAAAILDDMVARDEATYTEPLTIKRSALAWLTQLALLEIARHGGPDDADTEAMCAALDALWPDVRAKAREGLH